MRWTLKTTVAAAAGLTVLMLALTDGGRVAAQGMKPLLVQVMNTTAEPIPVVSPVERVVLRNQGGPPTGICPDNADREVERVFPDGTRSLSFTVPPGKVLVLTDLEAFLQERNGLSWNAGDVAFAKVASGNAIFPVITARGALTAAAVSAGVVTAGVHLESGGGIGPNLPPCISWGIHRANGFYAADLSEVELHGYLVDE